MTSDLYESREKITEPEEGATISQVQAFKTENIKRYIAEQVPDIPDNDPSLDEQYEDDVQYVKGLCLPSLFMTIKVNFVFPSQIPTKLISMTTR